MSVKVEPMYDNVLVKVEAKKTTTESGIIIPDTVSAASGDKQQLGVIASVGPGRVNSEGNVVPMYLKVGDKVLFSKFVGLEISYQGDPFLVLKETDILARINK